MKWTELAVIAYYWCMVALAIQAVRTRTRYYAVTVVYKEGQSVNLATYWQVSTRPLGIGALTRIAREKSGQNCAPIAMWQTSRKDFRVMNPEEKHG